MKKLLLTAVGVLAVLALVSAPAFAGGVALSDTQMDGITAAHGGGGPGPYQEEQCCEDNSVTVKDNGQFANKGGEITNVSVFKISKKKVVIVKKGNIYGDGQILGGNAQGQATAAFINNTVNSTTYSMLNAAYFAAPGFQSNKIVSISKTVVIGCCYD